MCYVAGAVFISAAAIVYAIARHAIELANAIGFAGEKVALSQRGPGSFGFIFRSYRGECSSVIGTLLALGVTMLIVGIISQRRGSVRASHAAG
jgi:hypothetical protein